MHKVDSVVTAGYPYSDKRDPEVTSIDLLSPGDLDIVSRRLHPSLSDTDGLALSMHRFNETSNNL